ncbi:MAG: aromatic acid exporter family protein [Alkalibacterium sp.]|nr:aromatic acid exporter family protein [Alkalibacterium sp.]
MKIGARTFKTSIAVFLSLLITMTLGFDEGASLAGISVVASMQPSVKKSYNTLVDRLVANTLGGFVAVLMASAFGTSLVILSFATAILIAILHQMKLNNVIGLSTMTLIIIMLSTDGDILTNATVRVLATFIGVVVAFIINRFILPPNYEEKLFHLTNRVTDDLTRFTRVSLRKNVQYSLMRTDLNSIEKSISEMKKMLVLLQDTQWSHWFRRKDISLTRMLVVYRQFIRTTESAYNLVKTLHHSENVYNHFPEELRVLLRERLETLMSAHEQIILKWNGRVLPKEVNFIAYKADLRITFMQSFFNEASLESYLENDYGQSNTVIHLMSAVLIYEENLQHLNKLVSSFKINHKDDVSTVRSLH